MVFAYMVVCVTAIKSISISSELCATPFEVSFLTFEMNEENNGDDNSNDDSRLSTKSEQPFSSLIYNPKAPVRMLSQTTNNAINEEALWPARACSLG